MKLILPYRRCSPGTHPELLHSPYASSVDRAPSKPLLSLAQTLSEITGPRFGSEIEEPAGITPLDMTRPHGQAHEAIGQRIVVSGRLLDEDGRPITSSLVEIWQANAAGRYLHSIDQHDAPLDPNFTGAGELRTDAQGRYRFVTILPGRYPWRNHYNAWRPAHIHFSIFGPAIATRLITQMYFPGDALLPHDPIFNSVSDEAGRARLIAEFDWESTVPDTALGFKFNMVLRGREATPLENQ